MPAAIGQYFSGLANYVGSGWNRFWFLPGDVFGLCVQRIACGLLAIVWQLSFTSHLVTWFGPQGWFDASLYRSWVMDESVRTFSGRLSYLFVSSDSMLWTLHIAGTIVLAAFTLGLWTRITSILSLVVVLAYIHRAPFLSGPAEPVLTMMIGYLCLAPCGDYLSLDAWRRGATRRPGLSVFATLATHLMQFHLAMVYLLMFCSKLAGVIWWNGEAIWWSATQPSAQMFDVSVLRSQPVLLNLWTYFILLSEASMATLIWNAWLRPLLWLVSALSWLTVAFATGNWGLTFTMWVANLAFVSSAQWRAWFAIPPAAEVTQLAAR